MLEVADDRIRALVPDGGSSGRVEVGLGGLTARSPEDFLYAGVTTLGWGQLQLSGAGGSMAVDHEGNVYVLEIDRHRMVKITPNGQVRHFAGSTHGESGLRNGTGDEVLFRMNRNSALIFDHLNNQLLVSDPKSQSFRKITPHGVSTTLDIAGQPVGNIDIIGSKGNNPAFRFGVLLGNTINGKSHCIFVNLATPTSRGIYDNIMLSASYGHIRFALDNRSGELRFPLGDVFGPGLNFALRESVISKFLNKGDLFMNVTGGSITEWAGNQNRSGYQDGLGKEALFNQIKGIAEEDDWNLVVLDGGNHALGRVRKADGYVTTVFIKALVIQKRYVTIA